VAQKLSWLKPRLLYLVCFAFVLITFALEISKLPIVCPKDNVCNLAGQEVNLEGGVVSILSQRSENTFLEVKINGSRNHTGNIQAILPHTQFDYFYGDQISLQGKLKMPENNPAENFSYPLYLAGQSIYSIFYYPTSEKLPFRKDGLSYSELIYRRLLLMREKIRLIVNRYLLEPDAAVMNSMLIGDQGLVPQELRSDFSKTGIIHILSVSGTHVTLLIVILVYLANKVASKRFAVLLLVTIGVIFYLLISGSPDCALRAGIMGLLTFYALQKGKLASMKILFWFSGAILLFFNPLAILSDIGFQLSYLAVFGMIYLFPLFDKAICWGRVGIFWTTIKIVLLSCSISLTVTPLVYYYFGVLSWISPLANLVLLPVFSMLLPMGFLLIILGSASNIFGFLSVIPNLLGILIHIVFYIIYGLTSFLLKIPGSNSSGSIKIGWILLYYLVLLIAILAFRYIVKKYIFPKRLAYFSSPEFLHSALSPPPYQSAGQAYQGGDSRGGLKRKLKKIRKNIKSKINEKNILPSKDFKFLILSFFVFDIFLLTLSISYLYSSSRPARLIMLDVGQGDAILMDWPKYHFQILVDGGPGRKLLSELGQTLPFYERKIELGILSHPHQDHLEGLISLGERYDISQVFLPSLPQHKDVETGHAPSLQNIFWENIIRNRIAVTHSNGGENIYLKLGENKIADFRFLTPLFDYSDGNIINLNNASAVLKMEYPKKILFMGDAQSQLEKVLLAKESYNIDAEIIKIGHHGSRFSSSDQFLDAVNPQKALISVGKDNLFGHPAKATIDKLKNREVEIYRTDLDGRVEINL